MIRNIKRVFCVIGLFGALIAGGCGDDGDGGATATPVALKFRTYSSTVPAFSNHSGIASIGFRVILPPGVTVATDPQNAKLTASGALKLSGVFDTTFKNMTSAVFPRPLQGNYSSAKPAGSGNNAVRVNIAFNSLVGMPPLVFGPGEFLTVNGTAAPGAPTAKSSFSWVDLVIGDYLGRDIKSLYKFGIL